MKGEMKVVTFKIDASLLQELDVYVANSGGNRSQIIREAIAYYLKMVKKNAK